MIYECILTSRGECGNAKILRYDFCFGSMLFVRSFVRCLVWMYRFFSFLFFLLILFLYFRNVFYCVVVVCSVDICWMTKDWNYAHANQAWIGISNTLMAYTFHKLLIFMQLFGIGSYWFHPFETIKMKNRKERERNQKSKYIAYTKGAFSFLCFSFYSFDSFSL